MSKSALVVDDSKSARFALRKYLENHAYKVDTAESAEQCYEYLKGNRPEVIFLDHVMPGADGFDVLKQIKSNPDTVTIPVVICSSNEGEEFTRQARSRGAADVLQKPPSPEMLTRVLDNLQRLAASFRPAPGKVTPIRPVETGRPAEAAIEEGVMRAVREVLPEPPKVEAMPAVAHAGGPPPHAAAPAAPAIPTPTPTAPHAVEGSDRIGALREQVEVRLRKITSEMFVQIAELKAQMANVDRSELSAAEQEMVRAMAREETETLRAAIHQEFEELRTRIDALARQQEVEHDSLMKAARAAAAAEAQAVAEKVVMNAAGNISRQLAEAITTAFGRH